jgi:hypothetical protein
LDDGLDLGGIIDGHDPTESKRGKLFNECCREAVKILR